MVDQFFLLYDQYHNTFNFVFALLATIVGAQVILFIFQAVLSGLTRKTASKLDDELVAVIKKPVYWGVIIGGVYFALLQIEFLEAYQNILMVAVKLLAILLLVILAIGLSNTFLTWLEVRHELSKKQVSFLTTIRKILNALIYFTAIIFVLQVFGLAISPLIASLGVGGLAVGLALQPTLSNYFSGLYVVSDGFVRPDDYIELDGGLKGYVQKVGWRNTVIKLWDNNLVMIPNSKLTESTITNFNEPQNKMSFLVRSSVAYDSNLKKVEKVALKVGRALQKNKNFGVASFKPLVRFYEFGESNIHFKLILQAKSRVAHFEMLHEAIKELKTAFDQEKITISFPMRRIELTETTLKTLKK